MNWTIERLTKELNLPFRKIDKFVKRFKPELKKYIRVGKNNKFEINSEGKNRLKDLIRSESNQYRGIHIKAELDDLVGNNDLIQKKSTVKKSPVKNPVKVDTRSINEAIAANLILELKQKNTLINNMLESHTKERERTDTIIMKLMHDLEKIRSENRNFIEMKPSESNVPCRGDSGMSMERYIDVLTETYRTTYQKLEAPDPLTGMGRIQKLYTKVFRPHKLRKAY